MEFLSNAWVWIVSTVGGISLAGIITAILYGSIKGAFNRTIQKINVEKTVETISNKQLDKIKKVTLTQNIQPIVESELRKIAEDVKKDLTQELKDNQTRYDLIIKVLEKFYAYFDDSLVADSKKEALKEALDEAKGEISQPSTVEVQEVVVEEKAETEPTVKPKKAKIER